MPCSRTLKSRHGNKWSDTNKKKSKKTVTFIAKPHKEVKQFCMADFLSNFSPTRSDLGRKPNELKMGQNKNQEVLTALLACIGVPDSQKKEKRIAWKTAFSKAKTAYFADFDQVSAPAFRLSTEAEREDAFQLAFSKLHDAVDYDHQKWADRADDIPGFLNNTGITYLTSMYQRAEDAPEDSAIVRALQTEQEPAFRKLYAQYRDYFVSYASKKFPKISLDDITDIYQDTWIVIIKYINGQKIRVVKDGNGEEWLIGLRNKASIKTLLTAIGTNMLKNGNESDLITTTTDPIPDRPDNSDAELDGFSEDNHNFLYQALETLGENCQFLLACRYWFKIPYSDIKDWTDAASEEALRTQMNRCKKYLTKAFEKLQGHKK